MRVAMSGAYKVPYAHHITVLVDGTVITQCQEAQEGPTGYAVQLLLTSDGPTEIRRDGNVTLQFSSPEMEQRIRAYAAQYHPTT